MTRSWLPLTTAATAIAALLSGPALGADKPSSGFTVTSPAFADNGMMARKNATNARDCGGQNISPALRWSHAPDGTKSFAIMMVDPDGRKGLGVIHWMAYDIPASKTSLKTGEASTESKDFVGGKNTPGTTVYYGPCPPVGDRPHHYTISVLALDLAPGTLQPGLDHQALLQAIDGHSLAATSLIGRYARH